MFDIITLIVCVGGFVGMLGYIIYLNTVTGKFKRAVWRLLHGGHKTHLIGEIDGHKIVSISSHDGKEFCCCNGVCRQKPVEEKGMKDVISL